MNFLKTFGCKGYVFIPKQKRRTLDRKCKELLFVGYSQESKAYRFLDPKDKSIVISKNAHFDENSKFFMNSTEPPMFDLFHFNWSNHHSQDELIQGESNVNQDSDEAVNDVQSVRSEEELEFFDAESFPGADGESENVMPEVELRRSIRSNKGVPPQRLIANNAQTKIAEPRTFQEAVKSTESDDWMKAMNEELSAIESNETWELTELPVGRKAVGCKWVFKVKYGADNKFLKFKARLVAKGFTQKFGEDYDEVFAPVVQQSVFRCLLAVASIYKMSVYHVDIKNAFLHGKLSNEIYMKQPDGFAIQGKEKNGIQIEEELVWTKTICKMLERENP